MNFNKTIISILIILFTFSVTSLYAAWLNNFPITITQPDGTSIQCYATGDEFYNWLHDENGFTIIQNKSDGYYYYAILDNNILIPTDHKLNSIDPETVGLSPWTNVTTQKMQNTRENFVKNNFQEKIPLKGYSQPNQSKNEGVLNNLVIYVRFSDQDEYNIDTTKYYNMCNLNETVDYSMQDYFEQVSYGQLNLPSWFYPLQNSQTVISYQDTYPRNYFKPKTGSNPDGYDGDRAEREHALLKRAVEFVKEQIPDDLDLDYDNDGYVDNIVFIVRGEPTAWATLLWPHRWSMYNSEVYINGLQVWDYNMQIETHLNSYGVGVLCHETYHTLGAPDLYHYTNSPIIAVGSWDVMENNSNPPQSMGAYMKFRYGGFIEEILEITECGVYTLNPIMNAENNCFKIVSPNSSTDFYVLEYRRKKGVYEGNIPSSGLLVYRINSLLDGQGNAQGPPDEVYIYRPGGTLTLNGNIDYAAFASDFERTEINDEIDPNGFLSNGNPGGLNISNVGWIGETISFEVTFDKEPIADFEASSTVITENCSIDFFDLSVCDVNEWNWTFEGGLPSSSNESNPTGITYESPGLYKVSLSVSNSFGNHTKEIEGYIEVSNTALPEVDFKVPDTVVCTAKSILIVDLTKVCPNSWNWEITPSTFQFTNNTTSSSQNPEVLFEETGYYSIKLTASNANGSETVEKNNVIRVGGIADFFESFEQGTFDDKGWTINNPDDNITWDVFPVAGNGGNYAAGINLFKYNKVHGRDQLISPLIDLRDLDQATLSFEHAYALWDYPQFSDSLYVKISDDCGENWTDLLALNENGDGNLTTREAMSSNFIPSEEGDWCQTGTEVTCHQIDISNWIGSSDVKIMFETVRLAGNNLFIDNVGINSPLRISRNNLAEQNLKVYPNPTNSIVNIELVDKIPNGLLRIYNSKGSIIITEKITRKNSKFNYDLSTFPNGLYFIRVLGYDYNFSEKLILQ